MCDLVKGLPVVSNLESIRFQFTTIKSKREEELLLLYLFEKEVANC
jgi:hypothetical protein